MCIAGCAAIWMCSASPANTVWECWPGYTVCFAHPRIVARLAAIAFSHFAFIAALCPPNSRWSRGRSRKPFRTSPELSSRKIRESIVDFHGGIRMIAEGDGVRLITAVHFAGQMMTPDKILVAEPCPRQASSQSSTMNFCARRAFARL
jgi:hypothetical protein